MRALVAAGVDVDARDDDRKTPLMVATLAPAPAAVAALLELGADPVARARRKTVIAHLEVGDPPQPAGRSHGTPYARIGREAARERHAVSLKIRGLLEAAGAGPPSPRGPSIRQRP